MKGTLVRVSGPLVVAKDMADARLYDVARVGEKRLMGEIIALRGDMASIQMYEDTSGLGPGEPVEGGFGPLFAELAPGLIGSVFDGMQRPLDVLLRESGERMNPGIEINALDRERMWDFEPMAQVGDKVTGGDFLGKVPETPVLTHYIMVPPEVSGEIVWIHAGEANIVQPIAKLKQADGSEIQLPMLQKWPVRRGRPCFEKLPATEQMVTGQRVLDTLFPLAKGGAAAVPGPFGSGKTALLRQIAKCAEADIVVYVGCGARGNEMADALAEFSALNDPRTEQPLMQRTVLIANTADMPVATREASIYTGVAIAEYFRDMGYSVALLADSASRWAEALREMSGRLEETPGEEDYPAYLSSCMGEFFGRAGVAAALGQEGRIGAITAIGAVSPPAGDLSEPVTQAALRAAQACWGLSAPLACRRRFPAIDALESYSLYADALAEWSEKNAGECWNQMVAKARAILREESALKETARRVGVDALSPRDRLTIEAARSLLLDYLHQSAFHETDARVSLKKQHGMLGIILAYHDKGQAALARGVAFGELDKLPVREAIGRLKHCPEDETDSRFAQCAEQLDKEIRRLQGGRSDD